MGFIIYDELDKIVALMMDAFQKPDGTPFKLICIDQMRLFLCMLLTIPLGWVMHFVPGTFLRHTYSIGMGLLLQIYMFGDGRSLY